MVFEEMNIEEVVNYINSELLKGRTMKEIEKKDFGVNERVIAKRLARRKIKKIDGQFVLQDGYKMPDKDEKLVVTPIREKGIINLNQNKDFLELKNRVDKVENYLIEIISNQRRSEMVRNEIEFRIYTKDEKPVAKTIRLYQDIWDKIEKVKSLYPHINYQTVLNSLLNEITEKYLNNK